MKCNIRQERKIELGDLVLLDNSEFCLIIYDDCIKDERCGFKLLKLETCCTDKNEYGFRTIEEVNMCKNIKLVAKKRELELRRL